MRPKDTEERIKTNKRLIICALCLVVAFFFLFAELYSLQLLSDDSYSAQSEKNRTRFLTLSAMRGNIYDSEMNELATSVPVFTVSLLAVSSKDREAVSESLAYYLNDEEISAEDIYDTLLSNARQYEAVLIKKLPYNQESIELIAVLEEHKEEIPGLLIGTESMRYYPYGSVFGHFLGYVGKISETELANSEEDYLNTDTIGKTGLEKYYETFYIDGEQIGLRGTNGVQQVEINAQNYPISTEIIAEPQQGNSLITTMDLEVQNVLEQSLESVIKELQKEYPECKAGAAVLLNVKTGAVIAAASYPVINPNDFADGLKSENYDYYMTNEDRPLINRAISGLYAPGSTFKIVTALAELYAGVADPLEEINCTSAAWVDPRAKCTREHGKVNLYEAIAMSCNTYFQEMGYRAGIEAIDDIAEQLGLGQVSGIDIPGEAAGILPSPEYKATLFSPDEWDFQWRDFDTFYTSMGQGYNTYTVLQLANYTATVANGGNRMQPYVVEKIIASDTGETVYQHEPVLLNTLTVSEEDLQTVQEGMLAVTQLGGTSYSLFKDLPIQVAAKTGTAQTSVKGSDNGVFIAYAPYDDPEVAFACVIEFGQSGGGSGGIVCYNVFKQYFNLNTDEDDESGLLLPDDVTVSIDDQ